MFIVPQKGDPITALDHGRVVKGRMIIRKVDSIVRSSRRALYDYIRSVFAKYPKVGKLGVGSIELPSGKMLWATKEPLPGTWCIPGVSWSFRSVFWRVTQKARRVPKRTYIVSRHEGDDNTAGTMANLLKIH